MSTLVSRDASIGASKPVERVAPGAWVLTYDDGSPEWMHVRVVLSLTHDSGRKATELRGVTVSGEPARVRDWNNEVVTALTAKQAQRAGLSLETGS